MLTATPKGVFSKTFEIARDGRRVCEIRQRDLREKAEVVLDGAAYVLENQLLGSDFLLRREGRLVARANKRTLRRAFDVTLDPEGAAPRTYAFEVGGLLKGGRYDLSEAGRAVGSVTKATLGRSARATFPDDVPEAAQVFLLWIALMMWARDRND